MRWKDQWVLSTVWEFMVWLNIWESDDAFMIRSYDIWYDSFSESLTDEEGSFNYGEIYFCYKLKKLEPTRIGMVLFSFSLNCVCFFNI